MRKSMSTMIESPLVPFRGVILIRYFGWMCGLQYIYSDFGLRSLYMKENFLLSTRIAQRIPERDCFLFRHRQQTSFLQP
jgi:hypothetical protein